MFIERTESYLCPIPIDQKGSKSFFLHAPIEHQLTESTMDLKPAFVFDLGRQKQWNKQNILVREMSTTPNKALINSNKI